jgi:hypothetical protein
MTTFNYGIHTTADGHPYRARYEGQVEARYPNPNGVERAVEAAQLASGLYDVVLSTPGGAFFLYRGVVVTRPEVPEASVVVP